MIVLQIRFFSEMFVLEFNIDMFFKVDLYEYYLLFVEDGDWLIFMMKDMMENLVCYFGVGK